MADNFGVALVKRRCPICSQDEDAELVMNTLLTKPKAEAVRQMHGKVIGMMDHPCQQCQDYMKLGVILVTVDKEKTTDMRNPYRTGGFFVVTDDMIRNIFRPQSIVDNILEKRVSFIEHEAAVKIGLFELHEKGKRGKHVN